MRLRVATFNVSMEGGNYGAPDPGVGAGRLSALLAAGQHQQISNIAQIIQHIRPDILLLNEFDYGENPGADIHHFNRHYLQQSQGDAQPILYPYAFSAPVNAGMDSGLDLDRDGIASGIRGDALGFGDYPGHYGMLLLSRYPIDQAKARTFRHFLWKDMPDNKLAVIQDAAGVPWYSQQALNVLPLSSKSHWDVPVLVGGQCLHMLASHPTPPVFDGQAKCNLHRNHDEIRFWRDYLDERACHHYMVDDNGKAGGLSAGQAHPPFVVVGDLNASVEGGEAITSGIASLLGHPRIQDPRPARLSSGLTGAARRYTASWGMRADYVLPDAQHFKVLDAGVFWPEVTDPRHTLIASRQQSSDHRLVWVDLALRC